jgi:hypothetical protein
VSTDSDGKWIINDHILPVRPIKPKQETAFDERNPTQSRVYQACLHWLLPDWTWELETSSDQLQAALRLRSPKEWLEIAIGIEPATQVKKDSNPIEIRIYRAGEAIYGTDNGDEIKGWISPTYGYKVPALSLEVQIDSRLPIRFSTEWQLPKLGEQSIEK